MIINLHLVIQLFRRIKNRLPYIIEAQHDESFTSWLIRLSRLHYLNTKNFCEYFGIETILKSTLDIDANVDFIKTKLNLDTGLPRLLKEKIVDLRWSKGKTKWLIESNRKGQAIYNSYTKYCVNCLSSKGYYQLKWKLNLFKGCVDCGNYLVERCPNCNNVPSPLKSDNKYKVKNNFNPLFQCWYCEFDLRRTKALAMKMQDYNELLKINNSYEEMPVNFRHLFFLQFGEVLLVSNSKI